MIEHEGTELFVGELPPPLSSELFFVHPSKIVRMPERRIKLSFFIVLFVFNSFPQFQRRID